ncbi:MAG: MdtA/MuxA family multidrug efflux RND transporter periplasmic adaptor subunit [Pseudomonadota bacterium]
MNIPLAPNPAYQVATLLTSRRVGFGLSAVGVLLFAVAFLLLTVLLTGCRGEASSPSGAKPQAEAQTTAASENKIAPSHENKAAPGAGAKKPGPVIPVLATTAVAGDIGVYLTGLGSITPMNIVVVKSRVAGQLMKVHFTEGQFVREGELLAEIDARPYAVQVAQMEGQLMRNQALLTNALLDRARYSALGQSNGISKQALATQEAVVAQHQGMVQSDRAQLDNAKLNLLYARITAPISGRVGLRQLDAGNMVNTGDGLLTIAQVEPITAVFSIPQDRAPLVVKKLRAGEVLSVEAYDREQKLKLADGRLLTVDNQIDAATGTLKCKAVFENRDAALFPNQFINARLLVATKTAVTLVPGAAIQRGAEQSTFVYVVDGESAVSIRPVTPGTAEGGLVEITSGLAAGEVVVLEGVDRLAAGTKVAVQMKAQTTMEVQKSTKAHTPALPPRAPLAKANATANARALLP